MPTTYPVSSTNLNWTPVTVGIVLAVVLGAWFAPGCGAARWYQGKSHTLESFHDVVRPRRSPPGTPSGNPDWMFRDVRVYWGSPASLFRILPLHV